VSNTSHQTKSNLPFHPLADMFPLIEGKDFDDLVADIKQNGLREEISFVLEKDGREVEKGGREVIVDGRNRYRACLKAGVTPMFRRVRFNGDDGLRAFIISKNITRRHLTTEQKRELIEKLLKADPNKSDTAIGKQAKVSKNTVAKARKKMEGRGQLDHVEKRTDSKGRSQPATKAKAKLPVPPLKPDAAPANPVAASLPVQPHPEELDTLRSFVIFTVMNVNSGELKLTGDPERMGVWKDLLARVAPFVKIVV